MLPQENQFWKITGIPLISLTLLQLLAMPESVAATPKITASASFSKKAQQLVVKGKATGVSPGTYVYFYDASSNKLLYSVKPDAKGTYTANLSDFNSSESSPCNIIAQVGEKKVTVKVARAAKTCAKTAVLCTATADKLNIQEGGSVTLNATTKGKGALTGDWDIGDGLSHTELSNLTPSKKGVFPTQSVSYSHVGNYPLKFSAKNSDGIQCSQSLVISVAPTLPSGLSKVSEQDIPAKASGMAGDYVVLPFNEKSEVGVSQLGLPYSAYIATQGINAQVFLKDPKKPIPQALGDVEVYYSAASNPTDPVGADSINSTSQNLFDDSSKGANFDLGVATVNDGKTPKNQTVLLTQKRVEDQQTVIKKSGFWDRILNSDNNGSSTASHAFKKSGAELTKLDQGLRHKLDAGAELRSMPGIDAPYVNNTPQLFKAYNPLL